MEWMQIQIFYSGLNVATKQMFNATAGGSLCGNQHDAMHNLIEEMATNGYQWSSERNKLVKEASIYEVGILTTLATQVEAINKRLDTLQMPSQAPVMSCEAWGSQTRQI